MTLFTQMNPALDAYGGDTHRRCARLKFYTEKAAGRWHLCTPGGSRYFQLDEYHEGLSPGATFRLFTVSGYLVRTLSVDGSQLRRDLQGRRVALGRYLYTAESADGEIARGKVSVMR
jgi:hypothetical protein